MAAIARLAVYPQVQQDPGRMQRAQDVIDLVCQYLHIGPPPEPDSDGMVTFVQIGPEALIEALEAVVPSWREEALFYVPEPSS